MTRTGEEVAQAVRTLHESRGASLVYLAKRILLLETSTPDSPRLPELRAGLREVERNRKKYE